MILKWTPGQLGFRPHWPDMDKIRGQMEGFLGSVADAIENRKLWKSGVYPSVNLWEDAENLYLTAELAGVASTDLEITIQGDSLTLRGERKNPEENLEVSYHRREREDGFFRRVVTLPVKIDEDNVKAKANNGILEVTMPKAAEAKARKITIDSQ